MFLSYSPSQPFRRGANQPSGERIKMNTQINITELERNMLTAIAEDECTEINGREPESLQEIESGTWANLIICDSQDKGVFTSLLKKQLVWHNGCTGRDAAVGLTQSGFDAYKTNK